MRIAFVSANREKLPDAVVPLGLLYVMAATPARHERRLIDLCFEPDPLGFLRAELAAFQPELVAIGLRNIQNNDYTGSAANLAYYADLVAAVRAVTSVPLVLGGGGYSVMPSQLLATLRADFGIEGEGEGAFPALVDALGERDAVRRGELLGRIGGLHYWRGAEPIANAAPATFVALDGLPTPNRTSLDPRYHAGFGIDSIQTSRGCLMHCEYCTYPRIEGARLRTRDPDRVVDELLETQAQAPIRHWFVVDAVFNHPRSHAFAVCKRMIARGFDTPWTCYVNPLGFDQELADAMAQAGCVGVEIGSESGCDDVLGALRKGFRARDIERVHEICVDAGISDCHTFILGTRTETLAHVERTLGFLDALDPHAAILMVWKEDEESLAPEFYEERQAFRAQIVEHLRRAVVGRPHWIVPALDLRFSARLFQALRRSGASGPLWRYVDRRPAHDLAAGATSPRSS